MNNIFKKAFSVLLVISLLSVFSVQTFAATSSSSYPAKSASYEMVDKQCKFKSIWKDSVTVKNNGKVAMWVYINNGFHKELQPGQTYKYSTWSNTIYVKVYSKRYAPGKHNIVINTTSGYIYNN